ncbi:2252_t:CDS:1, partial [Dentiscutata heterogama]
MLKKAILIDNIACVLLQNGLCTKYKKGTGWHLKSTKGGNSIEKCILDCDYNFW